MKYQTKPVEIDAIRFTGEFVSYDEICEWAGIDFPADSNPDAEVRHMFINTLEGQMKAIPGDYIIRGLKGEYYPCKPDIFQMKYEPVE